jgi:membrane associated rhomboid family serine protease
LYFFYYYPLGVDVEAERRPWVTWALTATMTGLFLAAVPLAAHSDVSWWSHAYRPGFPSWWTPLSAVFLHASWMHLAGNLVYILVFAPALERALGRPLFLLLFLVCGYLGNLAQGALVLHTRPELAFQGVVGASGAISGVLGIFLLRFHFARLKLGYWAFLPLQGINRAGTVHVPLVVGLALWVLLQVLLALVHGTGSGTAYGAHLGGLITGLLVGGLLGQSAAGRRERLRVQIRRRRKAGDFLGALAGMERYLRLAGPDEETRLEHIRLLSLARRFGDAQRRYRELVEEWIRQGRIEEACELHLEARRANNFFLLGPDDQRRVAFWLEKSGRPVDASLLHQDFARTYTDHPEAGHSQARAATLLCKCGRRDDGIAALDEAIRLHPEAAWRSLLVAERERLRRGWSGPLRAGSGSGAGW